jgi:hypothetical protein
VLVEALDKAGTVPPGKLNLQLQVGTRLLVAVGLDQQSAEPGLCRGRGGSDHSIVSYCV